MKIAGDRRPRPCPPPEPSEPVYEWDILVRRRQANESLRSEPFRVTSETPALIRASTKADLTEKVEVAFCAKEIKAFLSHTEPRMSHDWVVRSVKEV